MIPLIGINGWVQIKFMKGFSSSEKRMYEDASQVATDAVGSIRTIASFCAEDKVMELYKKKCEGPMQNGIRQRLISGIGFGVSFMILFLVYATSFYVGARLVEDGTITFPDVFRVSLIFEVWSHCKTKWTALSIVEVLGTQSIIIVI